MEVLAESLSSKIEKLSFSFKLQKLLENEIVLLREEQKFSFAIQARGIGAEEHFQSLIESIAIILFYFFFLKIISFEHP